MKPTYEKLEQRILDLESWAGTWKRMYESAERDLITLRETVLQMKYCGGNKKQTILTRSDWLALRKLAVGGGNKVGDVALRPHIPDRPALDCCDDCHGTGKCLLNPKLDCDSCDGTGKEPKE